MWMSSLRGGKIQNEQISNDYHSAWKCANATISMMNKSPLHVPTKKWKMKNSPKREWWPKTKCTKHKKTIQKVGKIGLIPHKVPKRWCWKHLWHLLTTPPNQDAHSKLHKYHEPLPYTHPNYHTTLMKWQMTKENIIKLQT